jgi:hypothetical protein
MTTASVAAGAFQKPAIRLRERMKMRPTAPAETGFLASLRREML